jgi:hypothetical protein
VSAVNPIGAMTTGLLSASTSTATQTNPVTRLLLEVLMTELETVAIENNPAFHATIIQRLASLAPKLVEEPEA